MKELTILYKNGKEVSLLASTLADDFAERFEQARLDDDLLTVKDHLGVDYCIVAKEVNQIMMWDTHKWTDHYIEKLKAAKKKAKVNE